MRILWSSNGVHTHTGYGNQTRYAVKYLRELGHELSVYAWYGLIGGAIQQGETVAYPRAAHVYGIDAAGLYAKHFNADAVVTLVDVWVHPVDFAEKIGTAWIAWFPVDGEPVSEAIVSRARRADYPVVFSRFALEQMERAGVECDYIPHGIDCGVYKPGIRNEARRALNIPEDAYMVTMVAANKGYPARKCFPEAMQAFAEFRQMYPEAFLYLHTDPRPATGECVYLDDLAAELGISEAVSFADQTAMLVGVPDEMMATIYQASDVLLSPSMGEGFGLPIAEAQACGCPVITQYVTAMAELTVNGVAIEPLQRFWIPGLNYWQFLPSVERIWEALVEVAAWSEKTRASNAARAIKFIRAEYDWPVVVERYWKPFLEKVEAELW